MMALPGEGYVNQLANVTAYPALVATRSRIILSSLANYLPLAVVVVPLMMLFVAGVLGWRATISIAEAELTRAAEAGAEYAERALEGFVALGGRVNDELRGLSDAEIQARELELHQELKRQVGQVMRAHAAFILDRQGRPLVASQIYPVAGAPFAPADDFPAFLAAEPDEIRISQPFLGPFDGHLHFAVSRRREILGPEDLAGAVVITIRPDALADGFRRIGGAAADTLSLVRADGKVLTRSTGHSAMVPPVKARSGFHDVVRSGAEFAIYRALGLYDDEPSLAAARRLAGFPVYATSRRRQAELSAHWRATMAGHLMFGVPATLGLLALSLQVRRDQSLLRGINARLEGAFETSLNRLTRARRFGLVGTFEYDLRSGTIIRSGENMEIHGLPPKATQETRSEWLGRLHPDDRERADSHLKHALSAESGLTAYAQSYRIVLPDGSIRWIAARAEIERDAQGHAVMMRGAHVDVTPLRNTELALAESDARLSLAQEALNIGTWEWPRHSRRLSWSSAMMRLWGLEPRQGQPRLSAVLRRVHPADRRRVMREVVAAFTTGLLHSEFRIMRPAPMGGEDIIWIVARAKLMPLPGNDEARLLGVAYDATDRKRAEERAAMLAHEVEHRAKNALALVASLLRMTDAKTVAELKEVMQGRVGALARTMGLLGRQQWTGAALGQIIAEELAPFRKPEAGEDGIRLEGPELKLGRDMVQPLSMAVHELATNAVKYGALSVPDGRLEVRWRLEDGKIHLHWRESGGPPIKGPPAQENFGSRLIDSIFQGQFGGAITRHWEEFGLVCEMMFPARLP